MGSIPSLNQVSHTSKNRGKTKKTPNMKRTFFSCRKNRNFFLSPVAIYITQNQRVAIVEGDPVQQVHGRQTGSQNSSKQIKVFRRIVL